MGSGAARGVAHIGVLQWLTDNGIAISAVAGCSAGAFMGAFFAAGYDIDAIVREACGTGRLRVARYVRPAASLRGFFSFKGPRSYIRRYLSGLNIEDLKVPYAAVATRLDTGEPSVFREGSVEDAILASIASPAIFPPYFCAGHYYIDGALSEPVPVSAAFSLGAERVIAVDVSRERAMSPDRTVKPPMVPGMVSRSFDIFISHLAVAQLSASENCLIIRPDLPPMSFFAFRKAEEMIEAGYRSMEERRSEINSFLSCG